eukprot:307801-Pyramimonas_sp.AAC.1
MRQVRGLGAASAQFKAARAVRVAYSQMNGGPREPAQRHWPPQAVGTADRCKSTPANPRASWTSPERVVTKVARPVPDGPYEFEQR